jgi:hypothetical protein
MVWYSYKGAWKESEMWGNLVATSDFLMIRHGRLNEADLKFLDPQPCLVSVTVHELLRSNRQLFMRLAWTVIGQTISYVDIIPLTANTNCQGSDGD